MTAQKELRVICPVYNESEECLKALAREWEPVLDQCLSDWEWVFIDDGSTRPDTMRALAALVGGGSKFRCWRIPNSGHGRACVAGYKQFHGVSRWLLQIDSDRQCRPEDFSLLWKGRREGLHMFGVRRGREDGWSRRLISLAVRLYLWSATGIFHPDPNCPYRLLWTRDLSPCLERLNYSLANIALALRLFQDSRFCGIGFRARPDGQSSHNIRATLRALLELADGASQRRSSR